MNTEELQSQLAEAREELEAERIAAADLSSGLMAAELQVADLKRRLEESMAASGDTGQGSEATSQASELEAQRALAEQYRLEAADLRSMFDAMQFRIDSLQEKLTQAKEAAVPSDAGADEVHEQLRQARARIEALESGAQESRVEEEVSRVRAEYERQVATLRNDREVADAAAAEGVNAVKLLEEYKAAAAEAVGGPATPDDVRALSSLLHRAAEEEARFSESKEAESEAEIAKKQLATERERSEELASRVAELEKERARGSQSTSEAEESAQEARAALESLEKELISEREVSGELAARVDELEGEQAQSQDAIGRAQESTSNAEARLQEANEEVAALQLKTEELSSNLRDLDAEVVTLRAKSTQLDSQSVEVGRLQESETALREQLADLEAQRSALAEEVERERALRVENEAGSERKSADANEELAALKGELASLQNTFDEAVATHAEEVRRHKEEASLQASLARSRENDMEKLAGECSILQDSFDEAIRELEGIRAERQSLSERLSEVASSDESSGGTNPATTNGSKRKVNGGLRLADMDSEPSIETDNAELVPAGDASGEVSHGTETVEDEALGIVLVHIDDGEERCGPIESAVGGVGEINYLRDLSGATSGAPVQMVVNLASESFDLATLSALEPPEAVAYCVKDGRGVFFGRVTFFPPPCDLEACSARLLSERNGLQRLLAVGEDVDFMSGLRERLGKVRCSTAIAFDGRQAVDLIPMVKPQLVLVDLNLPRGDGLRVASQVVANPDLKNVKVAMFWSRPVDAAAFRQQAVFAIRDFVMDTPDLAKKVEEQIGDSSSGSRLGPLPRGPSAPEPAATTPGN